MPTYTTRISRWLYVFAYIMVTNLGSIHAQDPQGPKDLYQQARNTYGTDPDRAIDLAMEAADLAIEENDIQTMAKAYFLAGYIYKNQDDIPNAFHFYFGAIRVYKKIGDDFRVQQLYENLAYIAELKGVHTIADQLRRDRLEYATELDYRIQADMHYDLGLSQKHQDELELALGSQFEALKILKLNPDLSDTATYANIWLELGEVCRIDGEQSKDLVLLDSARTYFDRSEHFNGGDAIHLGKLANNRGNLYRILGEYKRAKAYLFRSLALAGEREKKKITPLYNLGRIYYAEGQQDSAIWALSYSLDINISDVSYPDAQEIGQLNIELAKAPELFGAMAILDSMGMEDLLIRGRAMRHVYRMAKDRYQIIDAHNKSMLAQLYRQHREEMASDERWEIIRTWGLIILLVIAIGAAIWFWLIRYLVRRHNRRLAAKMEKRLKDKYGIG